MKGSIVEGAYDMHVHSGPDILPRMFDDFECAQHLVDNGMKGFVIKGQYLMTADRAELVRKKIPECDCYGSITLNNSIGGINPIAVDVAGRAGAKIVWFPTVDTESSLHDAELLPPGKAPYWVQILKDLRKDKIPLNPVLVTDEYGKILPCVMDVLDIIAKYDMILATGHISVPDGIALCRAAKERGVRKMVLTHADSPLAFYDIPTQQMLVKECGVFVEHCTNGVNTGKTPFEVALQQIVEIGCDHVINCTDLGQVGRHWPNEDLETFCEWLVEQGVSEKDVRKTIVDNPIQLLHG